MPKFPVRKRRKGPPNGDNSNSQYAALGIRACIDGGVVVPTDVLQSARDWWLKSQNRDGGWGYNEYGGHPDPAPDPGKPGVSHWSYGDMTAGAVGALCIYLHLLGEDYRKHSAVLRGMNWLTLNYDVESNPKKKRWAFLYYLYALERCGKIFGTEYFGAHEWYPEGAKFLLDRQAKDGSWHFQGDSSSAGRSIPATCFAVLFLRRGTKPLPRIETGHR